MADSKLSKFRVTAIIFLTAVIAIGGIIIWSKYTPSQPLEISLPPSQEWQGTIYIDGNVVAPGFYPLTGRDSLEELIQTAGGANGSANLSRLELYVSNGEEEQEIQKIDINRADVWLLDALPGIGEALARRIVEYRQQNGLFRNTGELLKVEGIGAATYDRIKDLITVSDR